MGKKLNYEYVKKYFTDNGCQLLEKEYINNTTKMKYVCKNGHEGFISWANFKSGNRCIVCGGSKQLEYDYIKKCFEEHGCVLLENKYINSLQKLRYICFCGEEAVTIFHRFIKSGCCKKCSLEKRKWKQEDVNQYFLDNKCKLLDKYTDANTPMKYICECGEENIIRFCKFKMGQRCRKCGIKKIIETTTGSAYLDRRKGPNNPAWNPDRERVKFNKVMQNRCQKLVKHTLLAIGQTKKCKSADLLGYTRIDLEKHLTNHPNWHKIKDGKWSVDHIFPIKAFVDHNITNVKLINCLDNLQPMLLLNNISKGCKYSEKDFLKWLEQRGVEIKCQ
jgi:hypothetical protein